MEKTISATTRVELQARKDYCEEERKSKRTEPMRITSRASYVICPNGHVYLATASVTRCPGSSAFNGRRRGCHRQLRLATALEIATARKAEQEQKQAGACDICSAKHDHKLDCPRRKPRVYPSARKGSRASLSSADARLRKMTVRGYLAQRNQPSV